MPTRAFLQHQSVYVGAHADSGLVSQGSIQHPHGIFQNIEPTDNTDGKVLYLISFQQQFALNRIVWLR